MQLQGLDLDGTKTGRHQERDGIMPSFSGILSSITFEDMTAKT